MSGYGNQPLATGFEITASGTDWNANNEEHIYMAIRRPHKTPEAGTEVFYSLARAGNDTDTSITGVGFSPDAHFSKIREAGNDYENMWFDKLRGAGTYLRPTETAAESTSTNILLSFDQDGVTYGVGGNVNGTPNNFINWMFKRAPGFFDVVAYTGSSSTVNTQNHNLTTVPELIITKIRSGGTESGVGGWGVYAAPLGSTKVLQLHTDASAATDTWFNATPTTTTFQVYGNDPHSNREDGNYIAYLFATLDGISKVGTYDGDSDSTIPVDCGFTNGARFVLIKRTDDTGSWLLFDSTRGIGSGNDPYLKLDSTQAELTSYDRLDANTSGFTVRTNADAGGDLNIDGGTYIYLAIA
jgi:hypothetical protein